MARHKRSRPSAEMRCAIMARFVESRLTVEAFCQRESISVSSFYRWRSVCDSSSAREVATRHPSRPTPSAVDFVELGTLQESHARLELRLDLGGGVLLHLVRR